ncbi:hypothetical protein AMAG_07626 [Allomyces macrogynus ATCC 38327]|uniref:MIR domain-containing protein n=1 Tax=Allomyces macrogynus (strain ATCC 38327) TaxID=578462 RepID=A0A0L0SIY7_ALLM3|nr:hypothetical protein AMAG_07626 [Allomyces macrogynus ATCC 38327]|eukprot:KNE62404.1 hypothetical protein AMAG_07626 [Allomyces macrogynus ATCC 38327]
MIQRLAALLAAVALVLCVATNSVEAGQPAKPIPVDDEFAKVTCGAVIKLSHVPSGFKLHSHNVRYGSGSGQQSVTALPNRDDPSSLWLVKKGWGESCTRGEPIPCGSTIRLMHVATRTHLHSHQHASPLSGNQEISAYSGDDTGDNWTLKCKSGKVWLRESPIGLVHEGTGRHLATGEQYMFQRPIAGQLEVHGARSASSESEWMAQEGLYFSARNNS